MYGYSDIDIPLKTNSMSYRLHRHYEGCLFVIGMLGKKATYPPSKTQA
jgi:hypothetical protein